MSLIDFIMFFNGPGRVNARRDTKKASNKTQRDTQQLNRSDTNGQILIHVLN